MVRFFFFLSELAEGKNNQNIPYGKKSALIKTIYVKEEIYEASVFPSLCPSSLLSFSFSFLIAHSFFCHGFSVPIENFICLYLRYQWLCKVTSAYRRSISYEVNRVHIKWSDRYMFIYRIITALICNMNSKLLGWMSFLYQAYKGLSTNHF